MTYRTNTFRLIDEQRRKLCIAAVSNAPIGIEVVLREVTKARGLDANGYYWMRLTEIAKQAWFSGKQYSKEVWHEYCVREVMPETVEIKDGEHVSKWISLPGGGLGLISTTKLSAKSFSEYCTAVEAFGASLGVQFSANPKEYT